MSEFHLPRAGPGEAPGESAPGHLERENRELAILNAVAASLNESLDLSGSLEVALSHVGDLLGLRAGWVWLLREDDGEPFLAAARNLPPGLTACPSRMEGGCYCLDTFRAGELGDAANVSVVTCSRLKFLSEGTDGLRYHASVPLQVRGARLGVMNVASAEWTRLSASELGLLHTIGEMVATAVERARLFEARAETGALEERNRLAREIHDTLAQGLAATALKLDTAEALLADGQDLARVRRLVGEALAATRRNLDEARRSVLDLRAAPLEGRSLPEALEALVGGEGDSGAGPDLRFVATGAARPLPARVEAALFRVAQEAVANARVHADASAITLELVSEPHRIRLRVEDDGRGFAVDPGGNDRFGLVGMRERVRLIEGELDVRSEPGRGTRLEATVPLRGA